MVCHIETVVKLAWKQGLLKYVGWKYGVPHQINSIALPYACPTVTISGLGRGGYYFPEITT